MALVLADRIKETTSTTGTGTYTLAGAENGFEAFSVIGNSNTTYYCCTDGVDFERGVGTYTLSGTTLARTSVIQSSNDDDEVVWVNGLRTIFCTQPAEKAVFLDATGNMPITNSASVGGSLTVTGDGTFGGTIGVTGVLTGTSLDISGNIDVDGITNLDVVDIDGAVDMASTLAVAGVVTANAGVVVDNITIDGTQIDLSSGDLTLDVAGDIILDAGGQNIVFKDDGTEFGQIYQSSNHLHLFSSISDADIKIQGNDGGATITAVLFDMSAAGAATFNDKIIATELDISGDIDVDGTTNLDVVDIDGAVSITAATTIGTNNKIIFRDAAIHISSTADGDLSIAADDEIDLTSTLIDINGNVEISGTATTTGVHTFTAVPVFPNNTVETADIQADAITGAKIADDAIDSEHYTDASIDTAHIANLQITTGLIAADAITEAKIADNAVESEHLNDNIISGQTALASGIADADELLISDAGTIKRTDMSVIKTYIGAADDATALAIALG